MRPAFQKDEAFLADVRTALAQGRSRCWWLGQSGFLVVMRGRTVLFDPYLSDSLTRKYAGTSKPHVRITERVVDPAALGELGVVDLITSSHLHTDHLDRDTLDPILSRNPQARLVIPEANREGVIERLGFAVQPRLVLLDAGRDVTLGGIRCVGIPAAHNEVERDASGHCRFLGYVVQWGGLTFYHAGDTLKHPGLEPALRPWSIDVAFLPINGNKPERLVAGNMDGPEAAMVGKCIGARLAIPCHFELFEFNTASPQPFLAECERLGQPCLLLRNGEGFDLSSPGNSRSYCVSK